MAINLRKRRTAHGRNDDREGADGGASRILIAVTAARSLGLLKGLPELLANRGWTVTVVSAPGEVGRDWAISDSGGVERVCIPMVREPNPLKDLGSLANWISLLRRRKPDIVVAGTPKAGLIGMVASKIAGVPRRVYQVHGLRLETTTGIFRSVLAMFERLACACATDIVAVSQSLADRMVDLGLTSSDRIQVLGSGSSNGVDLKKFGMASEQAVISRKHELNISPNKAIVGFVGRITTDKGISDLFDACEMLYDRGVAFELLLVGRLDGKGPAVRLVQDSVSREVSWLNYVGQQDELQEVYPLMDVFCLPTKREGFGNVVIEAAACQVPAVVTRATGVIDAVSEGETGLIVALNDPGALADALESLIRDKARAELMGDAARKRVEEKFARPYVQLKFAEYLETVIDAPRRRK